MAEFNEVMKQLARMASACNGKCDKCPLDDSTLCTGPWCFGSTEGIAEAERIVMQWAAEHPEPVYPTWAEWLQEMGVMTDIHDRLNSYEQVMEVCGEPLYSIPTTKVFCPIPADIAEKLGVKPKEG